MAKKHYVKPEPTTTNPIPVIIVVLLIVLVSFFVGEMRLNKYNNEIINEIGDISAPFYDISIYTNNINDTSHAQTGDVITLQFKTNEKASYIPVVEINNEVIEVYKEDEYYYADYLVEDQSSSDKAVSFNIYNYNELNGTKADITQDTTDNSKVYILAKNKKNKKVKVKSVTLNVKNKTLKINDTYQLKASISPKNAGNKKVTWYSSDASVATVSTNGLVTAISKGTTIITVVTNDGKKEDTVKITVTDNVTTKITSSETTTTKKTTTSKEPTTTSTTIKLETTNQTTKSTTTTTTSKTTTITTTTKKTTTTVRVSGVTLNISSKTLNVGERATLTATISPSNASNKGITWTSSNTNVATVSNSGVVSAISKGTATITVTTNDGGKKAHVTITVKQPVTGISLDKKTLSMKSTFTTKLTATVTPSNANDKTVTWTSSDKGVATIDANGNIHAKAKGTTTITATTSNGKKTTCTVEVKAAEFLFVGNSKTYYPGTASSNDGIPKRFKAMAANGGYAINYTYAGAGGKTLQYIYNNYQDKLTSKTFDYLILQEQNDNYTYYVDDFLKGAKNVTNLVKKKNSNLKVYVRQIWTLNPTYGGYSKNNLNKGYNNAVEVANNIGAGLIYDGKAFYAANGTTDGKVSLFSDERHQNKSGAYLAGACIYATILKEDPRNITLNISLEADGNSTGKDDTLLKYAYENCYNK